MSNDKATFSESINQQQLETPKSTVGIYELPCGYIDPQGVLHIEVQLREMTGREEDLLASNKIAPQKKINALIAACTERIGNVTDKMQIQNIISTLTQGDRVFLLIAIRRTTLGDDLPMEEECPECKMKGNYIANLGTLDIKRMADPMRRVFDMTLPSGKTIRFRVSNGSDEDRVAKVPDEEKLSMMLLCRTEVLNGKPPTMMDIKNLGWRDRQALRDAFEDNDGGVDSSLELGCPACGHEFKRDLDLGAQGFFFPGRVQRDLKKRSSI